MAIVPHTHALNHTNNPPSGGLRWECRVYPGQLSHTSQVRADMGTDLNRLLSLPSEVREEWCCA